MFEVAQIAIIGPALVTGILGWLAGSSRDRRAERVARKERERNAVTAASHAVAEARDAIITGTSTLASLEKCVTALSKANAENGGSLPRKLRPKLAYAADGLQAAYAQWRNTRYFAVPENIELDFAEKVLNITTSLHYDLQNWRLGRRKLSSKEFALMLAPMLHAQEFMEDRKSRLRELRSAQKGLSDESDPEAREKFAQMAADLLGDWPNVWNGEEEDAGTTDQERK